VSQRGRPGSFWPSRTQELLLQIGLGEPAGAVVAWRQLRAGLDFDTLEHGTVSVLPLVYRALSKLYPEDALLPRLKGVYRSAWVRNNLLAERLAEVVAAFESAEVESLLLGGLACAASYYPELGFRPAPALDFLIARESLTAATRALGRLGWRTSGDPESPGSAPIEFSNAHGESCLLRSRPAAELDLTHEALRASAIRVEIGARVRVWAPAPGDELLIACAAGARAKHVRSVGWLVDMAQILRTASQRVDWGRLVSQASACNQVLRMREAFAYLSEVADISPPPAAVVMLEAAVVSRREWLAYRCAGARVTPLGSLPQAAAEHLWATRELSALETAAALPAFLRSRWGVDHTWQLPLAGGRKAQAILTRDPREGSV
jgi:hypothetical protein